ncbi:MAG TPA: hypothetical protein VFW31_00855 [Candidatus Angelobacter sp.]|nr:hypothetical protein [Candidatus Angelobacter sp.]
MLKAVMLVCAAILVVSLGEKAQSGQTEKPSQWAMDNAMIGPDSPIEVPAGGSYQARVMYPVPDGPLFPLKADVTWWIEPAVKGILVEAKTGMMTVAPSVPRGTSALLHADVAGRKEKIHAKVLVYSAKADPLVGSWRVDSSHACSPKQSGSAFVPTATANDVDWKFHVDKEFWIGRELGIRAGVQQSGTYEYSFAHSALKLMPKWPAHQAESRWRVELNQAGDSIQLQLTSPGYSDKNAVCSYVLHRSKQGN